MSLPKVSQETMNSLSHSLESHPDWAMKEFGHMLIENPNLASFLITFTAGDSKSLVATVMAYVLLKRQAEAEDMEKEIKL